MADDLLIQPLVLDPAGFPPLPLSPGFAQLVSDELGNQATPTDGFDSIFTEAVAIVDAIDAAVTTLGGDLVDTFAEADTIDAAPVADTVAGFVGALPASSSAVDALGELLAGVTPPTPTGATCGTGGAGSPAPCGTHGDSSLTLSDDTGNCFAASTLPVVSIKDGACTFIVPVDNTSWPGRATVSATSLRSGDSRLFAVSNDTAPGHTAGSCISRVLFKLTPYRQGHYLAKFDVTTDRSRTPEVWCVIVDVIP